MPLDFGILRGACCRLPCCASGFDDDDQLSWGRLDYDGQALVDSRLSDNCGYCIVNTWADVEVSDEVIGFG